MTRGIQDLLASVALLDLCWSFYLLIMGWGGERESNVAGSTCSMHIILY